MNRYLAFAMTLLLSLFLIGCTTNRNPFPNKDLSNETWMKNVDTNPMVWTKGADRWFLTGAANGTELQNRNAPYSSAMSTMMVKVPDDFTRIKINGAFQVQIFGTYEHNSVYLYGPNDAVREIAVAINGNTLTLNQSPKAPSSMGRAIVRIGIRNLTEVNQLGCIKSGCGLIEGIHLNTSNMTVFAAGKGNIYLSGNLELKRVVQTGSGAMSLFGVNTVGLDVISNGRGSILNISGRNVGLRSIEHHGLGDINIIGATSSGLKISSDANGKIGISGNRVNLTDLVARKYARVFITHLASTSMNVYAYDNTCVGLAGFANNAYLYASQSARIYARYLYTNDAFVRASDYAHINVTASNRMFAAATGNASIYFFNSPTNMSQFVSGNGVVIPIWSIRDRSGDQSRNLLYKDSGGVSSHRYGRGLSQSLR